MARHIDLSNKVFGQLTVLHPAEKRSGGHVYWVCRCACGTKVIIRSHALRQGRRTSCSSKGGCLIGKRFGKLRVVGNVGARGGVCVCLCDCGTARHFEKYLLQQGSITSCGAKPCRTYGAAPWKGPNPIESKSDHAEIVMDDDRRVLVDLENIHLVKGKRWRITEVGYVKEAKPNGRLLSRILLEVDDPLVEVDHRDLDPLNNQQHNLRTCTHKQNMWNRGISSRNTTGYKGVSFHKGLYRATITRDGKQRVLGSYDTPEEAALAYNAAAADLFGEFARTNKLPPEREEAIE